MNKYRTSTQYTSFQIYESRIYWRQSVDRNHLTSSQKFNMSTSFHVGSLQAFITLVGFPSSLVSISVSSFMNSKCQMPLNCGLFQSFFQSLQSIGYSLSEIKYLKILNYSELSSVYTLVYTCGLSFTLVYSVIWNIYSLFLLNAWM